jgi:hypothetical protein
MGSPCWCWCSPHTGLLHGVHPLERVEQLLVGAVPGVCLEWLLAGQLLVDAGQLLLGAIQLLLGAVLGICLQQLASTDKVELRSTPGT